MTVPSSHLGELEMPIRELIVALSHHLGSVAISAEEKATRREMIHALCRSITSRGLDANSLVRHGMQSLIVDPLLTWMMLEETLITSKGQGSHVDTAGWKRLVGNFSFTLTPDATSLELTTEAASLFSAASETLKLWAAEANFDDLIDRTPPTQTEYNRIANQPRASTSPLSETYTWIYHRLAVTDLERWDESSLHHELRFVLGLIPPPVAAEIMEIVTVDEDELNRIVARRAISRSVNDLLSPLLAPLQDEASRLLGQGRFREASALFEFYERQRPEDPTAANNRGFCLIPIDHQEALHHLRSAEAKGYSAHGVLVYNICCCYVAMGQHAKIIDRAENYWQREREEAGASATLWSLNDGTWHLYHESDVPSAIARVALKSAQVIGLSDRVQTWTARLLVDDTLGS